MKLKIYTVKIDPPCQIQKWELNFPFNRFRMTDIWWWTRQWSLAFRISSRAAVVEVGAPLVIVGAHNIVAIVVLRQRWDFLDSTKAIVGVNDLEVSKVAGLAKALLSETTGAHLGGGVLASGLWVHHLAAPLHHGGVVGEVSEQFRRPIPYQSIVPKSHPPVSQLWILLFFPGNQQKLTFSSWFKRKCTLSKLISNNND